jgi:hypothetical protein
MTSSRYLTRIGYLMTICVLGGLLTACNTLGPSAIRSGRLDYNQAITQTNNQQMLMAIIHNRYEELGSLLAVASITANVRFTAGTELQLGFGASDNYSGNLVPFSASTVYEENPTISYTPVTGEKYANQLMSPLPVSVLAQLAGTLTNPAPVYTVLISSVNGVYNPDFLFSSTEPDPRFSRFVAIMTTLTRMHRLHWVEDPPHTGRFSVVIDDYAPTYTAEVHELLQLLGLPAPKDHSAALVLPVSQALDGRDAGGLGVTTRSVYRLMEILSAAVELPEQDQGSGVTADYPPPGPVGQALHVHYAKSRPDNAAVAVQHRDGWFYIDARDQVTKGYFRLLGTLWSVKIAESSTNSSAAPVLTIPVSR